MNYKEAREYINGLELSDEMNLQAISTLLGRLGNPQQDLKFIHVAGTNGKGSFISYITSILGSAGYRVGKYTSPAIFEELETIQVNGKNISEMDFAQYVTRIAQVISEMKTDDEPVPSPFEVETVISFMYFKDCNCDIVVLEAGLGGKLDATNVIDTVLMEVFMPIALDHVDYLGSTVEDVALAKSGIIKRSTDVISSVQSAEVKAILEKVAKENEASIEFLNTDDIYNVEYGDRVQTFSYGDIWHDVSIRLKGKFQIENAATALLAVNKLRELNIPISNDAVKNGMRETVWSGRFTVISENPTIIIDGAHNPQAATALYDSIKLYYPDKNVYFVFGIFKDKDYRKVIDITMPLAKHVFTVATPDNPRAMDAKELCKEVKRVNSNAEYSDSVEYAVNKTKEMMGKDDLLVIFGSLSFLKDAKKAVLGL